jgi:tetratricopeptide (TPR) repeat protein
MGEVYRARDLRLRREVAIKVLPPHLTADDDARERLEREAIAAAALDHPFICKVFEIGEHADALFVVMELIPGETLQSRLAAAALPWDEGLRIAGEIAEALEAAHARHIVHRDLKPGNIMLTPQQRVKVMDFGLAKQLSGEGELTAATGARALTEHGTRLGTPDYMSPEQAVGDTVDERSDLFSFGIVLCEMLTGIHPFRRASSSLTLRAILQDPPVIQTADSREVPGQAAMLLRRLLAKTPAERHATISEVRRDLGKLAASTEVSTVSASSSAPDPRRAVRPLIGRDAERAELLKRLDAAAAGQGSVVFIGGEAGIGKTRLIEELATAARTRGFMSLVGHCYEMEGSAPYVPFIEMLEYSARVLPPSTFRHALGESASEVAKLMPELRRVFPDIPKPVDLPPEQQRRFLFNAYREFVERASRMTPLAIVLEDLQWADEPTVLLLQHIAQTVSTVPLLIVGTYRDVELDATRPFGRGLETLVRQRQATRMALRRLPIGSVESMLSALSGHAPPSSLTKVIFNETEGNPFFVEEVFQHLVDEGALFDANGAWQSELKVETLQVPDSVRLIIGRRLDRLSEPTRRVLTTAALIGRVFSSSLLEALEAEPDTVLEAMEEAERAHLVVPESTGREPRYRFAHEPIRQTLADGLSLLRRQRLHVRIGDAIERVYAGAVEKHAPALAHHFNHAGGAADIEKTVKYLTLAAEQARAAAAHEESLARVDDALALLEGESGGRVARLHMLRARALSNLGRPREALAAYDQAITLFAAAGDVVAAATAGSALAAVHAWNADGVAAITAAERALAVLGDAAPALKCQLLMGLARSRTVAQQPDAGFADLERARELQRSIGDARLDRRAIAFEANMRYQVMHLTRALALADDAVQRAHAAGEVWLEVDTAWLSTLIHLFVGAPNEARRLAEARQPLAERVGHHSVVWLNKRAAASALGYTARFDEAERAARDVLAFGRSMKISWTFHDNIFLALINFFTGRTEQAIAEAQKAIAVEPPSYQQGMSAASLFWIRAHLRDPLALDELNKHQAPLPQHGVTPTFGAWAVWGMVVEGMALLDRHHEVASLYSPIDELLTTGAQCTQSNTLLKTAAGIAADCAGDWSRAEQLHQQAVAEADRAYPVCQPDARIWYAATLIRRNSAGDRHRAAQLLHEALSLAERFGMAPMASRAAEEIGKLDVNVIT